jgi:hypothetical protein
MKKFFAMENAGSAAMMLKISSFLNVQSAISFCAIIITIQTVKNIIRMINPQFTTAAPISISETHLLSALKTLNQRKLSSHQILEGMYPLKSSKLDLMLFDLPL